MAPMKSLVIDGVYSVTGKSTEAKLVSLRQTLGYGSNLYPHLTCAVPCDSYQGVDPIFDYSSLRRALPTGKKASGNQSNMAFENMGKARYICVTFVLPIYTP